MNLLRKAAVVMACLMLVFGGVPALAQTAINNTTAVPLSFTVGTSLSINCTTPTFTVAGLTATSTTITCTSNWNLPSNYGTGLCLTQYFSTGTPFGVGGPAAAAVTANANGAGFGPFPSSAALVSPQTCANVFPTLGAQFFGPNLFSSATEPIQSSRTDTDVIAINLTGVPAGGPYTGSLNFAIGVQ